MERKVKIILCLVMLLINVHINAQESALSEGMSNQLKDYPVEHITVDLWGDYVGVYEASEDGITYRLSILKSEVTLSSDIILEFYKAKLGYIENNNFIEVGNIFMAGRMDKLKGDSPREKLLLAYSDINFPNSKAMDVAKLSNDSIQYQLYTRTFSFNKSNELSCPKNLILTRVE